MRRTCPPGRTFGISLLVALSLWLAAAPLAFAQCPGNLLVNGGFEDGFSARGAGEVEVANGWHPWYQDGPDQEKGLNHRPEYDPEIGHIHGTRRIHEGNHAQKWGKVYASHNAGVYQQVNVPAGSGLRLTAWAQAWSSANDDPAVSEEGVYTLYIGIDPAGGTNWAAPSVVWSAGNGTLDQWAHLAVEATAQGGTVTVFLRGQAQYPLKHNDAYFDEVCLTTSTAQAPTAAPTNTSAPTTAPTATPEGYVAPTDTPAPTAVPTPTRSGHEQVYTVQPGDTLYAIATRHGLSAAELAQANGMGMGDILHVGRELIIPGTTAPTRAPTTSAPQPTTPAAGGTPDGGAPAEGQGQIRVSVFDDINGNGLRDAGEPLLAGARIVLLSAEGSQIGEIITDGVTDPHTFQGLAPGAYTIREEDPSGYASTSANQWTVPLDAAGEVEVFFGNRVAQPAPATVAPPPAPAGEVATPADGGDAEGEAPASRAGGIAAFSGVIVALGAVGLLVGRRVVMGRR